MTDRSITQEGDTLVIRLPREDWHTLRVALQPRLAGDVTSKSTDRLRVWIDRNIAMIQSKSGS